MKYDFKLVSPFDFQLLVRDLLLADRGVRFEDFAPAPDGGIDLLLRSAQENIVVQCKHFANSTYPQLLAATKQEASRWTVEHQKAMQVYPLHKYILVTSSSLTYARKLKLESELDKVDAPAKEVLGGEDLNSILTSFPEIEQRSFNLWITSVAAMQRVLHSDYFGRSEDLRERSIRRLQAYVMNPSFIEAQERLEADHVVVIAGEPGIGKTVLAEALAATYVQNDYEIYEVSEDVSETHRSLMPNRKQLFLYDDFLGMTSLEHKFNKNEEDRLLSLVKVIQQKPKARLILTTREYILRQAQAIYEKIDRSQLELLKYVIEMKHLNRKAKADILYRHLFFSSVPMELISELIRSGKYLSIIDHPNYNPRLIESLSDAVNLKNVDAASYPLRFISALENPESVWGHPFERQLSTTGQDLVLATCTYPSEVLLDRVKLAAASLEAEQPQQSLSRLQHRSLDSALREVEGSFLAFGKTHSEFTARVMKPSVRDYCEAWFDSRPVEIVTLLKSAVSFEQCVWVIQQARSPKRTAFCRVIMELPQILCEAALRTLHSPSSTVWSRAGEEARILTATPFSRICRFLECFDLLPTELFEAAVIELIQSINEDEIGQSDVEDINIMLSKLSKIGTALKELAVKYFQGHLDELARQAFEISEIIEIVTYAEYVSHEFSEDEFQALGLSLSVAANVSADDDYRFNAWDEWKSEADKITSLASALKVDVQPAVAKINSRILALQSEVEEKPKTPGRPPLRPKVQDEQATDKELEQMFETLLVDPSRPRRAQ